MSTIIEIAYHPELNSIECVCVFIGTFHVCTKGAKGNISFVRCKGCIAWQSEMIKKEFKNLTMKK